jgi:hypothetical protein
MPAKADETLKFRHVQHSTSFQTQPVGDVERHNLGLDREQGIVFFPDGSTGTISIIGTFDASPPSGGTTSGYHMIRFADGSELWLKYTGALKFGNPLTFKGTEIVIGGKGRYADAKGDGTYEGKSTQLGADGAILYVDNVVNIKK